MHYTIDANITYSSEKLSSPADMEEWFVSKTGNNKKVMILVQCTMHMSNDHFETDFTNKYTWTKVTAGVVT